METKKRYQLLGCFLRENALITGMLAFFTLVFVVIFSLYKLELEAVLYAAGLCIVSVIVLYAIRFTSYCKEYEQRQQLVKRIEFAYEQLPQGKTLAERTPGKFGLLHHMGASNQNAHCGYANDSAK